MFCNVGLTGVTGVEVRDERIIEAAEILNMMVILSEPGRPGPDNKTWLIIHIHISVSVKVSLD